MRIFSICIVSALALGAIELTLFVRIFSNLPNLPSSETTHRPTQLQRSLRTTGVIIAPAKPPFLGCHDIEQLDIVRTIGDGKHKRVYEVQLPWGERAVVKRCKTKMCVYQKKLQTEANFLKELQDQNAKALQVFGICDPTGFDVYGFSADQVADFSVGYTSVLELGQPLIQTWLTAELQDGNYRECFARHFTPTDLQDFQTVARHYANHAPHPFVLKPLDDHRLKVTDNVYAEQYILTQAGIRHGDFDMVHPCEECSYEQALEMNCEILRKVTFTNLNCSSKENSVLRWIDDQHINVTEANATCHEKISEAALAKALKAERKEEERRKKEEERRKKEEERRAKSAAAKITREERRKKREAERKAKKNEERRARKADLLQQLLQQRTTNYSDSNQNEPSGTAIIK